MELNELTIRQAREKLDNHEITSVDLTKACLQKIKSADKEIHACLLVLEKSALAQAKAADARIKAGETGDLLGIPYLAKDNILTKGTKTTAGSKMLENYIAPFDATIIKKLNQAGAVLLGKTNLDEFAHGASTENSAFGPTKNPRDLSRVPGGSSGGSAAAVAANMCLFALGTDTGGSIRHPAAFCGVVGLKPTYGRCSRFGLVAMTSSTDVPGPIVKTVEDALMILKVIEGVDERDGTTVKVQSSKSKAQNKIKNENAKFKIGVPKGIFDGLREEVAERIEVVVEILKKQGHEILEVELPHARYGVSVYYIITPAEISSNLARFDGLRYGAKINEHNLSEHYLAHRGQLFGAETKRRIMLGTYALSSGYYEAYYGRAQKVRTEIIADFDQAFAKVDVILTPTAPDVAFKLDEKNNNPLAMYLEDYFLAPPSLAGLPAISLPAGEVDGLPVGIQLIGNRFADELILKLGEGMQIPDPAGRG